MRVKRLGADSLNDERLTRWVAGSCNLFLVIYLDQFLLNKIWSHYKPLPFSIFSPSTYTVLIITLSKLWYWFTHTFSIVRPMKLNMVFNHDIDTIGVLIKTQNKPFGICLLTPLYCVKRKNSDRTQINVVCFHGNTKWEILSLLGKYLNEKYLYAM